MTKREKLDHKLLCEELGPSDDPDHMLTLYDLIPEEWIGGNEDRGGVAARIAAQLRHAILAELREPDDKMITIGRNHYLDNAQPREIWQAMIGAIGDE